MANSRTASLTRHLLQQRRVIRSLYGVAIRGLLRPLRRGVALGELPGPELRAELPPPPASLIRDYVSHFGGDSACYADTIPPHLFPHWSMPLAAETLRGLAYPLLRVVNAGCRLEVRGPLRAGVPLLVRARLESVDDNGRRVLIEQRIVTEQAGSPEAVVAHVYAVVPLVARGRGSVGKRAADTTRVPATAQQIGALRLGPSAGLDFALLTGDFNPVHWVRPYARALGHRGAILHGFATMAHVYEALERSLAGLQTRHVGCLDVRFARPLVLPAAVGIYRQGDTLFVGAPGEPALLTGSCIVDEGQQRRPKAALPSEGATSARGLQPETAS